MSNPHPTPNDPAPQDAGASVAPPTVENRRSFWSVLSGWLWSPKVKVQAPNLAFDIGLTELYVPTPVESAEVDIIAIHGLGGHCRQTWTYKDKQKEVCWLRDFLPQSENLAKARVWTYGYDANPIRSKSVSGITDIARHLLTSMDHNLARTTENRKRRPVILICHSLGGIVVKKALKLAKDRAAAENQLEIQKLYSSIHGIVFMGTPHTGSDYANVATLALRAAKVCLPSYGNSKLLKSLKKESERLSDISEEFRSCLSDFKLVSFYENKRYGIFSKPIVTQASATFGLPHGQEEIIPSTEDHRNMVKFSDINEPRYKEVCQVIERMVDSALQPQPLSTQTMNIIRNQKLNQGGIDYKNQVETIMELHAKDTCSWLLADPRIKQWLTGDILQNIWLNGDPGSGKTVLSAFLVRSLEQDPQFANSPDKATAVIYHFFDSGNLATTKCTNAMASLLRQLLHFNERLCSVVDNRESEVVELYKNLRELANVFKTCLQKSYKLRKLFIVIDGIDEYFKGDSSGAKEGLQLLEHLFSVQRELLPQEGNNSPVIKIFIASRRNVNAPLELGLPGLDAVLAENASSIVASEDNLRADIRRYVTEQVKNFQKIDWKRLFGADVNNEGRQLRERLENVIVAHGGESMLIANFAWKQFLSLGGLWTKGVILERLDKLEAFGYHTKLNDMYAEVLRSLTLDDGPEKVLQAKRIFKWLVVSDKPVTWQEANIFLGLGLSETRKAPEDLHDADYLAKSMDEVSTALGEICGPFIRLVDGNQTMQFIHITVREFFLGKMEGLQGLENWKFTEAEAARDTASICITYLSFKEFTNQTSPTTAGDPDDAERDEQDHAYMNAYPLLRYASCNWARHTRVSQTLLLSNEKSIHLLRTWVLDKSANLIFAFRIYWYFGGLGEFPRQCSWLHVASFFGLADVIKHILNSPDTSHAGSMPVALKGSPSTTAMANGLSPLCYAAMNGHVDTIGHLVEFKAFGGEEDIITALRKALESGQIEVAKTLLSLGRKNGAAILKHSFHEELETAAAGGHLNIAQLLIEDLETDVNCTTSNEFGTALEAAAYYGRTAVVDYLLRKHADPQGNLTPPEKPTNCRPLVAAAFSGHIDIIELLLKAGADINNQEGIHGNALQVAAHRGLTNVARLLLAKGANVNLADGPNGSALSAALHFQDPAMIQLLKDNRAVESPEDKEKLEEWKTKRTLSWLDPRTARQLQVMEHEVAMNDLSVEALETRHRVWLDLSEKAITGNNPTALQLSLNTGFGIFKIAVRLRRENFLLWAVNAGVTLLQKAFQHKNYEAARMLAKAWANCLCFAILQKKPGLVKRMVANCARNMYLYVEQGKYDDAVYLIYSALEILKASTHEDIRNRELFLIMTDICCEVLEKLIASKPFFPKLKTVILEIGSKLVESIDNNQDEEELFLALISIFNTSLDIRAENIVTTFVNLFAEKIVNLFDDNTSSLSSSEANLQSIVACSNSQHLGEAPKTVYECLFELAGEEFLLDIVIKLRKFASGYLNIQKEVDQLQEMLATHCCGVVHLAEESRQLGQLESWFKTSLTSRIPAWEKMDQPPDPAEEGPLEGSSKWFFGKGKASSKHGTSHQNTTAAETPAANDRSPDGDHREMMTMKEAAIEFLRVMEKHLATNPDGNEAATSTGMIRRLIALIEERA